MSDSADESVVAAGASTPSACTPSPAAVVDSKGSPVAADAADTPPFDFHTRRPGLTLCLAAVFLISCSVMPGVILACQTHRLHRRSLAAALLLGSERSGSIEKASLADSVLLAAVSKREADSDGNVLLTVPKSILEGVEERLLGEGGKESVEFVRNMVVRDFVKGRKAGKFFKRLGRGGCRGGLRWGGKGGRRCGGRRGRGNCRGGRGRAGHGLHDDGLVDVGAEDGIMDDMPVAEDSEKTKEILVSGSEGIRLREEL